jgi:putative glutamine amidotransferase
MLRLSTPDRSVGATRATSPLIAVTTSEMRSAAVDVPMQEADPPRPEMALGLRYLEAIEKAGGIPVVLAPLAGPAVDALLDRVDGLCLSGGPDIHPIAYGHQPHPALGPTAPRLDTFELRLARAAYRRGLPVLGICRGAQLLNVARGGTLHQHLPDVVGTAVTHRQTEDAVLPTHPVATARPSLLAEIVGAALQVNSLHHQAVDRLGAGLVASAWATDGTIEGFEARDHRFFLGVQWHAECLTDLPEQAAIFSAFLDACEDATSAARSAAAG